MRRIDLKLLLQRTVAIGYGDLVTRPTGQAVRGGIEHILAELDGEQVAVIDFTTVRCLDISCADEIVGKLLLDHGHGRYFLLHGVSEAHCEAIEQVLQRHRLAVVARDRSGRLQLLGPIEETARRAWAALLERGAAQVEEIAEQLAVPSETARRALDELLARHLVLRSANRYAALTRA